MVTGDNIITAQAIAKECGIIDDELLRHHRKEDCVMEGIDFFNLYGPVICRTCKLVSPCECDRKDVKEGMKELNKFK